MSQAGFAGILAGALHGALIGVAAWSLARRRAVDDARERRVITIASSLLVANWATASLALNMNDPPVGAAWLETIPDQYFRYAALVAAALMTLAGFRVLEAPVREADQRTWSVLGFRAAVMSAVLFVLLFLPYPRVLTARFAHQATFGAAPDWWPMFRSAFSWVENVQRACSYAP